MRAIEWAEAALADLAALDRTVAMRVKVAIERFVTTGAGDLKKLQSVHPPEYRLRVGDWRIRFRLDANTVCVLRVRHRSEAYR